MVKPLAFKRLLVRRSVMWWYWNIMYMLLGVFVGFLLGTTVTAGRYIQRMGEWLPTHREWFHSLRRRKCPVCKNEVLHATTNKPHTQWYKCPICGTVYESNDFMWLAKLEP